jgi:hypothetical protein
MATAEGPLRASSGLEIASTLNSVDRLGFSIDRRNSWIDPIHDLATDTGVLLALHNFPRGQLHTRFAFRHLLFPCS